MHAREPWVPLEPADSIPGSAHDVPHFRLLLLGGLTLLRPDGSEDTSLGPRGRKLVLLAYLVLSRRAIPRELLATVLWGHRDDERARHSLREALSGLRRTLGAAIPRGTELVAVAPDAPLDVDVLELRAAARSGDHERVVSLYRGPFLDGVFVGDAPEIEDWIAVERVAAERLFVAACAPECARLADVGNTEACAALAHRWLGADPMDDAAFVWRLRALAADGTSGALRRALDEFDRHGALLANGYEEEPGVPARLLAAELAVRLADAPELARALHDSRRLEHGEHAVAATTDVDSASLARTEAGARDAPRAGHAISSGEPAGAPTLSARPGSRTGRRRAAAAGTAGLLMIAAIALAIHVTRGGTQARGPRIVFAGIENPSRAPDDSWLENGLPRLLATSLIHERVSGVMDPSEVRAAARRVHIGDSSGRTDAAGALLVARQVRATTLVSGEVTRGGGRLLLDLAIRDVRTGAVLQHISVSDTGLFGLVDQATARVLAAVDRPRSIFRFEDVETSSVEAYRAYADAMDRLDAGRMSEGARLLDVAIAADSTFAAALEQRALLLAAITRAGRDSLSRINAAVARARQHEPTYDRDQAAIMDALDQGDPVHAVQAAHELVARYPRDARAYTALINALIAVGDFREAYQTAGRALALDSARAGDSERSCATCSMYGMQARMALDLGDAQQARAAARHAVTARANQPAAWSWLARAMVASGRPAEAIESAERALMVAPREESVAEGLGWLLLETGSFAQADSLIRVWGRPGSELAPTALDLRGALLREQGRFRAAAGAYERALSHAKGAGDSASLKLPYASSLARSGDTLSARRVFEQAAHPRVYRVPVRPPSHWARAFAWPHALMADALFLAGSRDTLEMLALADSIDVIGHRGAFGRDWRLPFHVRGLVAEVGGRWPEAERDFERARWGRGGWTRTNVELARTQIVQGRPLDAVATLHDTRFGTLDGMGRYAPRTDIDAWLVEAFVAAGAPDSARFYVNRVRRAWVNAEPPQLRRLAALESATLRLAAKAASDSNPLAERRPDRVGSPSTAQRDAIARVSLPR